VKDMTTGLTTVATKTAAGEPLNGPASDLLAELSGDGRKVVFMTSVPATGNDTNHATDVYVRDLAAGTTALVSAAANGNSAPDASAAGSTVTAFGGRSISADGRFVVFESADDLTGTGDPGASTSLGDIFLRDLSNNTTRLLSTDPPGTQSGDSFYPTISADGRFVAFYSDRAGPGGASTLLVQDISNGQEVVVNQGPAGLFDLGTSVNSGAAFSRGGNLLLFLANNDVSLVAPAVSDVNGAPDLLARTLPNGPLDSRPPTIAAGTLTGVTTSGGLFYDFDVTYADDTQLDAATLGAGDLVVTGPNGYRQPVALLSATPSAAQVSARYRVVAPNGVFDAAANGAYAVEVAPGEVADFSGNTVAAGPVAGATFTVNIPMPDGPDLQATTLTGAVPPSLIAGAKQKLKPLLLTVTNGGTAPATGTVSIRVVASADAVADANDAVVAVQPRVKLKLLPGQTKVLKVKAASMPAVADGDYRLMALVDAGGVLPERLESNNAAALAAPVHIAAPFVDVGIAGPTLTGKLAAGKKATLLLTARNDGNKIAKGAQPVRVRLTADSANPAAASREFDTTLKLSLKPGATKSLRTKLTLPADLPSGSYFVVVELLPAPGWLDTDATDNAATSAAPYTV